MSGPIIKIIHLPYGYDPIVRTTAVRWSNENGQRCFAIPAVARTWVTIHPEWGKLDPSNWRCITSYQNREISIPPHISVHNWDEVGVMSAWPAKLEALDGFQTSCMALAACHQTHTGGQADSCRETSFPDENEWTKHSLIVDPNLELMCLEVRRVTLMDRCRWHRKRDRWYSSWGTKISIAIGSLASRVFNHYHHQLQNLFPKIFNNIIFIENQWKSIKSFVKVP